MDKQFLPFKRLSSLQQALEIKNKLESNSIQVILADNVPPVDITFSGSTVQNQIDLKIKKTDFEKANKILEEEAEEIINDLDKEYYLFEFTNDELYEILLKPDEWNEFDYKLSQKILTERGKSIDPDLLNSLRNQRLKELAKPEENQKGWIWVGYILTLLGGFFGMIIGYLIWTSQKTLPNGEVVNSYSEHDRKHGKYIFFLGLLIIPFYIILKILKS